MSSSDDDMLVDPEGFYTRALADFDAYAKSIGLEGKWWDNFEMWEWYGVPHLTLAENIELVRLNFLCRTVDAWLDRHCLLCHSSSSFLTPLHLSTIGLACILRSYLTLVSIHWLIPIYICHYGG